MKVVAVSWINNSSQKLQDGMKEVQKKETIMQCLKLENFTMMAKVFQRKMKKLQSGLNRCHTEVENKKIKGKG